MQSCDVLIVGGGPAGSTCAWKLRQAGLSVVVLDKATFPRHKVCAGWITPGILDELELDAADYGRQNVMQPITSFRAGCVEGSAVEIAYDQPVSYGIRRCEFDHYLLARCGATLGLGQSLDWLERDNGCWVVNRQFHARMLVGAGGHFCPVARQLGNQTNGDDVVVAAQEIEFEMDADQQVRCRVAGKTPEVYFCEDLQGYGWCFRKGNFLNVGLGRMDRRQLSAHVARFCQWLKATGRIPLDLPDRFRGHAYYGYHESPRKLLDEGVLLVGDAAGLAYSESGEGIRPAIESGLMAANVILQAGGDYRQAHLEPYRELVRRRFGTRKGGKVLADGLLSSLRQRVGRRLLASPWFVRHVVLDRWFLHRRQPAWRAP